jgi:hypothetical protein
MTLFAKLWTDVLGDEKLMRAARKGARNLQLLPWLIAFAKKAEDDGRLTVDGAPAEPIDISTQVPNATPRAVAASFEELLSVGVLIRQDDGALAFANWHKRSERKPSDDPDAVRARVQKHRARNAKPGADSGSSNANGNAHVTPSVTRDVTPSPSRERARESKSKSREQEKEQEQRAESKTAAAGPNAIAGVIGGEPQSAAIVLVSAANRGIAERWGEQPSPILPTSGSTFEAIDELARNGVPVSFARDAIYTWCVAGAGATSDGRPPRSLRYFVGHVTDRWTQSQALSAAATSDAHRLPDASGEDDWSRGIARGVELENAKDAAEAARKVAHG